LHGVIDQHPTLTAQAGTLRQGNIRTDSHRKHHQIGIEQRAIV